MLNGRLKCEQGQTTLLRYCVLPNYANVIWVTSRNDIPYADHNTEICYNPSLQLGPNIHWTSNYGTGIVFIGNMLSWLSFHNFV